MLLVSPDPKQKQVTVEGQPFHRTRAGYFEVPNVDTLVGPLLADGFKEFIPQAKPGEVVVPDNVKSAEFHAVVIRCTCPPGEGLIRHPGQPCPNGIPQDMGVVASFYRNPFTRFIKWASRRLNRH